ncbi:AAA family ATPase [Pantoea sp. JK]|nr:AAA family ATPase [Pantoea sp. JK]
MARGELMKKLLASYGNDDEFRLVAERIISEEEKKNNKVLANSLRRTLENSRATEPNHSLKGLEKFSPMYEGNNDFVERVEPSNAHKELILSFDNVRILKGLIEEYRYAETIRKNGLPLRTKLLFCGPPGCGKTLSAEVFSSTLGLPMFVVKLDKLISSYLGETATNIRSIFEFANNKPCILFLDEFDAIARSREDGNEHNELKRVVNSLLLFIERLSPKGFMISATNLDKSIDPAVWRRFDEVIWFKHPDKGMIKKFLKSRLKNIHHDFDSNSYADVLNGLSFSSLERILNQAIKYMIIRKQRILHENYLVDAINDEYRRNGGVEKML